MKKLLVLTISSLFLVACGSSENVPEIKNTILEPSLADISGVWYLGDTFEDEDANEDEFTAKLSYWVITEAGEIKSYYYVGLNDLGCYSFTSETITDLGNGSFELSDSDEGDYYTSHFSLINNELILDETFTSPKSSLQESNISPLCSE